MTAAAVRLIAAICVPAALACCGQVAPVAVPRPGPRTASAVPGTAPSAATEPAPKPGKTTRLPLEAFFPLQQSSAALTYDVRPGFFYGLGHIPGALSWPKSQFAAQLAAREPEIRAAIAAKRPVVLYCTDLACPDSDKVATRLTALGYSVSVLEGGFAAWKAADLPSE